MSGAKHLEDAGLGCLTLLLRFHGIAADPTQISHQFSGAAIGIAEMLRCAREFKIKARAVTTDWPRLANCLCRRSPNARTANS